MTDENLNKTKLSENWSRSAVMYQIYPRSFFDTNSDGIGDLPGIIKKLDYLNNGTKRSLGIEAIWLSPVYKSPQADFGYDISDFCAIDPIFGDIDDFKKLIHEAHERGIRVIMDFVPNHSSTQHEWFLESRKSRDNAKADWYIWRDPKPDGSPPNNWLSVFGGSAWEFDSLRGQYYMHSFLREQADLNWRNEKVRKEMFRILDYWLDFGVDGFRTDAVYHLIKDKDFLNDPPNPNYAPGKDDPYDELLHIHSQGGDATLEQVNAMCLLLGAHDNKYLVSEAYLALPEMKKMYNACSNNLHAPFNFNLMTLPWSARKFKDFVDEFESSLEPEQWPNYVMGNHDRSRVASRLGIHRVRIITMLIMTLRGMPLVYYGDELGMQDGPISPEDALDPFEKNVPGMKLGRDPERTPMQWNDKKHAGFTTGKPWLPVSRNYKKVNVSVESKDPTSLFSLYRNLIHFRKESPAILIGQYASFDLGNSEVFAYKRTCPEQELLIVLNFSDQEQKITHSMDGYRVICNTLGDRKLGEKINSHGMEMRPYEGLILEKISIS